MITITVSDNKLWELQLPCYAVAVEEGFELSKELRQFAQEFNPDLPRILEKSDFTGKLLQTHVLPVMDEKRLVYIIFVGLGKSKDKKTIDIENYRRVVSHILKQAEKHKCESLALHLPSARLFDATMQELGKQAALFANMAAYHFAEYITEKERKGTEIFELTLCVDQKNKTAVQKGVKEGECIAQAVNKARHWIDLPPSKLTPPYLADKGKAIAKKHGLTVTVFNEKQINQMGMGGLSGVSAGSDQECRLLIMEYKTKKKTAPTLVFVGKGITFDSGGLSLKPPVHMETMKEDMSGAAAVIATMEALAILKPSVNVIGVTPLAENLPSGKATKPGDIVRFYNGKTAEVKNTDAEGRLVLADALSYAVKHYKPDAIIDIATLTGACAHALGPFYTGLMSEHDELTERVRNAAQRSGDRVWQLPMHDDYKVAIQSPVADICNIGSGKYMAGAITAACFLQHFVDDVPWVHLDIAGTAYNVPDLPYYRPGATGAGVRLLVDLAMNW